MDLAQAQLLLIQAQNDLQASFAELAVALGYSDLRTFELTDEPLPPAPPANETELIQQALKDRPELISERLDVSSAERFATAERDLKLPTVSALGTAGLTPFNSTSLAPRYAAAFDSPGSVYPARPQRPAPLPLQFFLPPSICRLHP